MNKLVILSGVPGSGKSYFSSSLKNKRNHVYIVSSDNLRKQILGSQRDFTDETTVWKVLYELVKAYSFDERGVVVLDATNIYSDNRIELFHMFKKYYKEIYLVYFSIKTETLINQNEEREFPVPLDVLEKFRRRYETPTEKEAELFKGIYKVENHDIEPIVDKILEDEKSNA